MDSEKAYSSIVSETRQFFKEAGFSKAVLGLSGGLDSALTALVLADAFGKENVTCLLMPDSSAGSNKDISDAIGLAKQLGLGFHEIALDKAIAALEAGLKWRQSKVAKMNLRARLRMLLLYNFANSHNALVVGTGNKSELLLGYFTKHGDGAADFFPLRGLLKTEIIKLASFKKLPKAIIEKKPSAGLFPGQTDEKELGAGYAKIDAFLQELEKGKQAKELRQQFPPKLVDSLLERIRSSEHKRN